MRRRLLGACLRAYPRDVRTRDGAELRELAEDLAADHGAVREALGLVRGGWAERRRRAGARRVRIALAAVVASVVAVLTWSAAAAAEPDRVEEEQLGCSGDCRAEEREVAQLIDDGWACAELRTTPVTWRCTLD